MEWLILLAVVAGSIGVVIVLARHAARPETSVPTAPDDPHAGTLAEVSGQQGPRIYDVDG